MYACVHETSVGFFEAVCPPSSATAKFHDPPPPRFALHLSCHFNPFTTEKLYFYVYVRYESRSTSVRILLSLSHLLPRYGHWL